jgi:hypothetical protein
MLYMGKCQIMFDKTFPLFLCCGALSQGACHAAVVYAVKGFELCLLGDFNGTLE